MLWPKAWTLISIFSLAETQDAKDDFVLGDADDDELISFKEAFEETLRN